MKFKNKITKEVIVANNYALKFAYSHNSNWEKVKETSKGKKPIKENENKAEEIEHEKEYEANKVDSIKL